MDAWRELHSLLDERLESTEASRLTTELHDFWHDKMAVALGFAPEAGLAGFNDPGELLHVWLFYRWFEDYDGANEAHAARRRAVRDVFRPIEKRRPRGTALHLEHFSPSQLIVARNGKPNFTKTVKAFATDDGAKFLGELPLPTPVAPTIQS